MLLPKNEVFKIFNYYINIHKIEVVLNCYNFIFLNYIFKKLKYYAYN